MIRIRSVALSFVTLAAAACAQTKSAPPAAVSEAKQESKQEAKEVEIDVREVGAEQKVVLADAIAAALAHSPGEAIEAGLEGEMVEGKRDVFIEVMVLAANGDAIEVKVDATTGKVLSASKEDEADEAAELVAVEKRLPAGHMSLADLARRAATGAPGKMVALAFASRKGADPVAVVQFLDGKSLVQLTLDPKTGATLAKKKVEKDEEDEDDDDDDETPAKK